MKGNAVQMFYHNPQKEKNMVIPSKGIHEGPKPSANTVEDIIRKIWLETVGVTIE